MTKNDLVFFEVGFELLQGNVELFFHPQTCYLWDTFQHWAKNEGLITSSSHVSGSTMGTGKWFLT